MAQLKFNENDDLAVAVSREHAWNNPFVLKQEIYCFDRKENIYSYNVVLLMRKNYKYLEKINKIILRAVESGLLRKWLKDSQLMHKQTQNRNNVVKFSVAHIGSALLAIGIGSSLAILTAIAEQYTFYRIQDENCHTFWLFANKFFDGRRFYCLVDRDRNLSEEMKDETTILKESNIIKRGKSEFIKLNVCVEESSSDSSE